ncbi:MAG: hypothetical protein ASARMPRED_001787 [Alectoria sarmentosa]|nr:MAG: hypothetical protein ASARMPRED_001787 [Alectoria sarmentosa]
MNASVNASVAESLTIAADQAYGNYGNLTLLWFNATLGVIVIDPSTTNVSVLSPAFGDLFAPDVFSIPQACAYPISGQYGFLNRLLYYCLILVAVLAASNSWLCWAALGIAMSYSAGACLHAFALFSRYHYDWPDYDNADWYTMAPKYYGDIDLQGIFPILVAGCIALPPILNWSYLLRGSKGAKPVIVLWGAMMFAAVIPSLIFTVRGIYPFEVTNQVTYCPTNAANNCTFDALYNYGEGIYSSTVYNLCQCNDTCGAVVPNGFPFRNGQSLQAVLTSDRSNDLNEKSSVYYAFYVNAIFLLFILSHGILGLIEASWSQQHIRDTIFRRLSGTTRHSLRRSLASKIRHHIGKYTAGFFFVSAIVVTVLCPPVFISSVIINEIVTWNWPVAENYDAVGQWGPMVAAAFAIIAATIQAISVAWEDRKSAKSNTTVSEGAQRKRKSFKDLWKAVYVMLQDFKYWLVEGSLHEPLKLPKESDEKVDAKAPAQKPHGTFKEVQISSFHCDRCKRLAIKYQCTECEQGYCRDCWPRTQKRGAHLDGTVELQSDPKHQSMLTGYLKPHSATSSLDISPTQTSTEYAPLPHIEEGSYFFSRDISPLLS